MRIYTDKMKTTITTTIDTELKSKVMPIIQNKLNSSVAKEVSKAFQKILDDNNEEKN